MSHTSGKIRKSQRLGRRAFKIWQHLKAGYLRQTHLRTVILRIHPHRRKERQGHHRNLSLDIQVNLFRSTIPVTPITTRIQTRAHTVPSSGSSIRCVFLVDTTRRTRSAKDEAALLSSSSFCTLCSRLLIFLPPATHFIIQLPSSVPWLYSWCKSIQSTDLFNTCIPGLLVELQAAK